MNAHERIAEILKPDAWQARVAEVEGDAQGPLIIALEADSLGRERAIFVELLPRDQGDTPDAAEIIGFSYVHPYALTRPEMVPDLIRVLLFLNRLLPLGAHNFCEESPGVYFSYSLLVDDIAGVPENALRDVVGLIEEITSSHGTLIEQVIRGQMSSDDVIEEMRRNGFAPRPIFSSALAAE